MSDLTFGKTMENVRKHTDIKLVTTQKSRKYLVSEPNYHKTKFFLTQKQNYFISIQMVSLSM